ncbi:MAG: hypothetical protein LBV45_05805 [Xanthomonadaceae bacterium]|jgi:hypothetical protein|nr:hypothetical protein [Xanthomonadaceae bacterium]
MTFRVYLRDSDQRVTNKTTTEDQSAALAAFATLVNRAELDGKLLLAVLNCDGRPVAHHDFSGRDPEKSWRGRLDKINFS